jgi:uncharacterized RDD family membrane protein YckC
LQVSRGSLSEPCGSRDHAYMLRVYSPRGAKLMASFGYTSVPYNAGLPDPAAFPEAYEGVLLRRALAYFVDLLAIGVIAVLVWIVFAILWFVSFGLLGPVLWFLFGLIPLAYHTLLLSGPWSATVGMRLFDVELRSVSGERPGFLQALAQTALFYVTVGATCSLILVIALLNRHKRTLHDWLAGTVVVRRFPARWGIGYEPWRR